MKIIIKADVRVSAEALASSLQKIEVENVKVQIIHIGVGAITESDIILASASNAIVIGFNVRPDVNAQKAAQSEGVDVRLQDRKSTRLNSSHVAISYAVFCLKKKKNKI